MFLLHMLVGGVKVIIFIAFSIKNCKITFFAEDTTYFAGL